MPRCSPIWGGGVANLLPLRYRTLPMHAFALKQLKFGSKLVPYRTARAHRRDRTHATGAPRQIRSGYAQYTYRPIVDYHSTSLSHCIWLPCFFMKTRGNTVKTMTGGAHRESTRAAGGGGRGSINTIAPRDTRMNINLEPRARSSARVRHAGGRAAAARRKKAISRLSLRES